MTGLIIGTGRCACAKPFHDTTLIAVTGGPGTGKTAVLELAARMFCSHVGVLPEAAGIVFGGGFPRHGTAPGRRAAQRAIFHIQREVETLVADERRVAIALCDRGTVDGLAYWPDSADAYWRQVGSSLAAELSRYAAVVHLRTPGAGEGYNQLNNTLRIETAEQAAAIDARIAAAWSEHPRRFTVASATDFMSKADEALRHIRDQLPPCCRAHSIALEHGGHAG